ncbi:DUF6534 domain-containing protein [Rhodotorula paludigena]|uniref:DUF6534 domain-containing protein n=1 Tax=Rhodotorula paludigena TaxID=86838 RepID=UPI00316F5E7C
MGNVSSIDQSDYPASEGVALQENANWTLGPLFFGWGLNLFLCGIVLSWAAGYWRRAKGDRLPVKTAVMVAVLSEVATAVANFVSIIDHGKEQNRSNYAISLLKGPDALSVTFGTVTAVAVQTFFALRCLRVLPKPWRIPFAIWTWALILASFGTALGITIVEFINHGRTDATRGASPDAYDNLYRLALVWLFCGAAADISISTVLIGRLWFKKRSAEREGEAKDTFLPPQSSLTGFMRVTFEAAVCTSVTSLIAGVTYVTLTETTNTSYALSNLLPGLYACSLLWVLNSAHRLEAEIHANQLNTIQLVWNLGPSSPSPSHSHAAARERDASLARIARGGEGEWELKRGLASEKARRRLGEEVQMLSIRSKTAEEGEGEVSEMPPRRAGRGSDASLWTDGKGEDEVV